MTNKRRSFTIEKALLYTWNMWVLIAGAFWAAAGAANKGLQRDRAPFNGV
jgi:hypothetical protein